MPSSASQTAPLTFERFWRWISEHPNCVVRAGTGEATLFDFDDYHWDFQDEEDGQAVVGLVRGKNLVGELLIDKSQVLFVQASPDVEAPQAGHWLFEVIGGSKSESFGVAWFVVSHAIESTAGHQMLKH